MTHAIYKLISSDHPVWDSLNIEDMDEAQRQLERGEHPDVVTRRLFDWAAQYRFEQHADSATLSQLHSEQ